MQTATIDLAQATHHREIFTPTSNQTNLELCGLLFGKNYSVKYVSNVANNGFIQQETQGVQALTFTAIDECLTFPINTEVSNEVVTISVSCQDCPQIPSTTFSNNVMQVTGIPDSNAEFLVQDIFIGGNCYETFGASISGNSSSVGIFSNASAVLGVSEGIVLSTGSVVDVGGPSNSLSSSSMNGLVADVDLDRISNSSLSDIAVLEFDFVPTVEQVSFQYAFASEEYCTYVNPGGVLFNDIFGFFISGPGLDSTINLAEIAPGIPVSINTINAFSNFELFNPNGSTCSNGQDTSMIFFAFDGFTEILTAVANVIPCETYHIKLAIADGLDDVFDSAVFLRANRFDAGGAAIIAAEVPLSEENETYESEECGEAFFTFSRGGGSLSDPVLIDYTLGGTATNGVDYNGLPPSPITIPAGVSDISYPINMLSDNLPEGSETIDLTVFGGCSCSGSVATINIVDLPETEISISISDEEFCGGSTDSVTVSVNVTGGFPEYIYDWGEDFISDNEIKVGPTETTTYTVTVTDDCGTENIASATVNVTNYTATLTGSYSLCDENNDTELNINFSASEGPFEITYSIDGVIQPTLNDIFENPYTLNTSSAGTYVLESVAVDGCQGEAMGTAQVTGSEIEVASSFTNATCVGTNSGAINLSVTNPNSETVTYLWSNASTAEDQENLPAGEYSVTISTDNCEVIQSFVLSENIEISLDADAQQIDCNNATSGSIDLTANGGNGTLIYDWSNGADAEDLANLTAGTYTVTVTDSDDCFIIESITINENTDLSLDFSEAITQDVNCASDTDGSIDLNLENADELTFIWSTNAAGQTEETATNLALGTYHVTVTNAINCATTAQFEITEPTALSLTATTTNPDCVTSAGTINLSATGGNPLADCAYVYTTNPTLTADDCGIFIEVPAGNYEVSATDANGCTVTETVIIQTVTGIIMEISAVNISCEAANDGTITATADGGTPFSDCPYLYFIEPELTSTDCGVFANAAPGLYTIIAEDALGCQSFSTVEITEPTLLNLTATAINPDCSTSAGTINLSATGGNPLADCAYIYTTNPTLTADDCGIFTEVPAGNYEVSATDANGCTVTETAIIEAANVIIMELEAVNISCQAANNGTITVTANGGTPFSDCAYLYSTDPELTATDCGIFTNATPGLYTITAEDALGCQVFSTVEITEPNALSAAAVTQDISCPGEEDGMVTFQIEGGTPPYSGDEELQNLTAGTYNATLTDAANCTVTVEYTIVEPSAFSIEADVQNATSSNAENGIVFIENVDGGTPPYQFLWSNGDVTTNLQNVPAGTYALSVTDAQSCVYSSTYIVDAPVPTYDIMLSKVDFFLRPNLIQQGEKTVLFIDSPQVDRLNLQVFSIEGKALFTQQDNIKQGENEIEIGTKSLSAGVYFLQLQLNDAGYSVVKFVVY